MPWGYTWLGPGILKLHCSESTAAGQSERRCSMLPSHLHAGALLAEGKPSGREIPAATRDAGRAGQLGPPKLRWVLAGIQGEGCQGVSPSMVGTHPPCN